MRDDQWFQPGDKVILISKRQRGNTRSHFNVTKRPQLGHVYCIEDFHEGQAFNVVMLVGFGGWRYDQWGRKVGWSAWNFRKVSEVKLILQAMKQTKKQTKIKANSSLC